MQRALASIENAVATGDVVPADAVIAKLEARLAGARARKAPRR